MKVNWNAAELSHCDRMKGLEQLFSHPLQKIFTNCLLTYVIILRKVISWAGKAFCPYYFLKYRLCFLILPQLPFISTFAKRHLIVEFLISQEGVESHLTLHPQLNSVALSMWNTFLSSVWSRITLLVVISGLSLSILLRIKFFIRYLPASYFFLFFI